MRYPYRVLGVDEGATQEQIRNAYLEKVREHAPERDPERFQEICEAYALLKDEAARARLKLFGLPGARGPRGLAELVPRERGHRLRIGTEAWLEANRKWSPRDHRSSHPDLRDDTDAFEKP